MEAEIKAKCLEAIRRYRAYKKVPFYSFSYTTCARLEGEYLLARAIVRILKKNQKTT